MLIRNKADIGLWHCWDLFCVIWHFTGVNKAALLLFQRCIQVDVFTTCYTLGEREYIFHRKWQKSSSPSSTKTPNENISTAFIQFYLAQISSSSPRLGCCTHNSVSSAWNSVPVNAHRLSSTSNSITNERPFTRRATVRCSFILMNQDTNTLSLKNEAKAYSVVHFESSIPPLPH